MNYYHINVNGIDVEVKDILASVLSEEEFKGAMKAQAIQYLLRAGRKNPETEFEDIRKAIHFLTFLMEYKDNQLRDFLGTDQSAQSDPVPLY
jgi:hypothetical protein